jgi:hypothetical protein
MTMKSTILLLSDYLFFDPEDGGNMFIRNVGGVDYVALQSDSRFCEP